MYCLVLFNVSRNPFYFILNRGQTHTIVQYNANTVVVVVGVAKNGDASGTTCYINMYIYYFFTGGVRIRQDHIIFKSKPKPLVSVRVSSRFPLLRYHSMVHYICIGPQTRHAHHAVTLSAAEPIILYYSNNVAGTNATHCEPFARVGF